MIIYRIIYSVARFDERKIFGICIKMFEKKYTSIELRMFFFV